jgi:hypothetical protein
VKAEDLKAIAASTNVIFAEGNMIKSIVASYLPTVPVPGRQIWPAAGHPPRRRQHLSGECGPTAATSAFRV